MEIAADWIAAGKKYVANESHSDPFSVVGYEGAI
jgi:hypothetical protein